MSASQENKHSLVFPGRSDVSDITPTAFMRLDEPDRLMVQPIKRSEVRGGGGVERRLRDDSVKTERGDRKKSEKRHRKGGHTNAGVSCCILFIFI